MLKGKPPREIWMLVLFWAGIACYIAAYPLMALLEGKPFNGHEIFLLVFALILLLMVAFTARSIRRERYFSLDDSMLLIGFRSERRIPLARIEKMLVWGKSKARKGATTFPVRRVLLEMEGGAVEDITCLVGSDSWFSLMNTLMPRLQDKMVLNEMPFFVWWRMPWEKPAR